MINIVIDLKKQHCIHFFSSPEDINDKNLDFRVIKQSLKCILTLKEVTKAISPLRKYFKWLLLSGKLEKMTSGNIAHVTRALFNCLEARSTRFDPEDATALRIAALRLQQSVENLKENKENFHKEVEEIEAHYKQTLDIFLKTTEETQLKFRALEKTPQGWKALPR